MDQKLIIRKSLASFLSVIIFISPISYLFSQEKEIDISKIVYTAEQDAERDAKKSSTTGWLLGATGLSLLLSPLLGGLGTVAAAYSSGGDASVPTEKIMKLEEEYGKNFDAIRLYSEAYEKKYKEVRRKKQGGAAWTGTGIGFLVNLVLIAAILNSADDEY